uniref:hypothetical protein n=1 Tax=Sodalis glossinidius TaxID=63612 RepID=UPI001F5B178E|nr:hypothetical protein [Sodalis glossinidius]
MIISPFIDDPSEILGLQKFSEVLEQISRDMGNKKSSPRSSKQGSSSAYQFHRYRFDNLVRLDTAIPTDKTLPAKFGEGMGIVELLATRHGRTGNAMRSLFLDMRKTIERI